VQVDPIGDVHEPDHWERRVILTQHAGERWGSIKWGEEKTYWQKAESLSREWSGNSAAGTMGLKMRGEGGGSKVDFRTRIMSASENHDSRGARNSTPGGNSVPPTHRLTVAKGVAGESEKVKAE